MSAAMVVIMIGRNRTSASWMASRGDFPARCASIAKSTIHDPVLLHETDEHDDPDERVDGEVDAEEEQRHEGAEAGERQGGEDREGMDEALVEDAEHDVDDEDRHDEQQAQAAHRLLERLRGALEPEATVAGSTSAAADSMPCTASPSELPGARLKLMFTAGS